MKCSAKELVDVEKPRLGRCMWEVRDAAAGRLMYEEVVSNNNGEGWAAMPF